MCAKCQEYRREISVFRAEVTRLRERVVKLEEIAKEIVTAKGDEATLCAAWEARDEFKKLGVQETGNDT